MHRSNPKQGPLLGPVDIYGILLGLTNLWLFVNENIKVWLVESLIYEPLPLTLQLSGVNPPIILSYSVLQIVNVFSM